jgi:exodeoxyribonuclease VII large subunit
MIEYKFDNHTLYGYNRLWCTFMEKPRFTLLELTKKIGEALNNSLAGTFWLVSEINEIRENPNGHCYLELVEKDQERDRIVARSRATIWGSTWRMLRAYFETSTMQRLTKGMMVLTEVSIEFHELYGISLNIKDIDPVYTIGELQRKRAETIRRLEKEGIINMNRELEFPLLPGRIAVISSAQAAGYEDFMHQIANNPKKYRFEITLFPAVMQGDNSIGSVTGALESIFNHEGLYDVVVILRGGGSASDLSCFDSYEIAVHISQMPLPVITGIGHERDRTIAGMVAHTDLKTPTAVAEFLIGRFHEQDIMLAGLSSRLAGEVSAIIRNNHTTLNAAIRQLPHAALNNLKHKGRKIRSRGSILALSATNYIQKNKHIIYSAHRDFGFTAKSYLLVIKKHINDLSQLSLPRKTRDILAGETGKLEFLHNTLNLADPANILRKGYALVHRDGKVIKSVAGIKTGEILETRLHDGWFEGKVLEKHVADKN